MRDTGNLPAFFFAILTMFRHKMKNKTQVVSEKSYDAIRKKSWRIHITVRFWRQSAGWILKKDLFDYVLTFKLCHTISSELVDKSMSKFFLRVW